MYLARSILAVLFFFSSVGAVKAVFASEDSSSIDLIIIVAIVLFTGIVALRKGHVLFAASFYLLKQDVMRVSLAAARIRSVEQFGRQRGRGAA